MKPRYGPIQALVDHLASTSHSPESQRLLDAITEAGLNAAGALDCVVVLGDRSGRSNIIEWLANRAPGDEMAALSLLVALRPELIRMSEQSTRLARCDIAEAEAEILAAGWEVITSRSAARGRRRVEAIWTRARSSMGLRRRCPFELVPLDDGFDAVDPIPDHLERWPGLLAAAVAAGVLNPRQVVVVAMTRMEGHSIPEVAQLLRRPQGALYKERQRAEEDLRLFALSYDWSGS